MAIVGPSGAGKSSFIQAGIVPRLKEQRLWTVIRMRPGNQREVTRQRLFRVSGRLEVTRQRLFRVSGGPEVTRRRLSRVSPPRRRLDERASWRHNCELLSVLSHSGPARWRCRSPRRCQRKPAVRQPETWASWTLNCLRLIGGPRMEIRVFPIPLPQDVPGRQYG